MDGAGYDDKTLSEFEYLLAVVENEILRAQDFAAELGLATNHDAMHSGTELSDTHDYPSSSDWPCYQHQSKDQSPKLRDC